MKTITRCEFLQRAAILFIFASTVALLDACGILPAPTPTPAKIYRIGWLTSASSSTSFVSDFVKALRDLGYEEGKNIHIEYRYAEGNTDQLPALASELVALKVDVIVTPNVPSVIAAKNATNTIPIVMANSGDVVGLGIVASLAHPGGNVTGVASFAPSTDAKRLQLFKEALPKISRVAITYNPSNPNQVGALRLVQDSAPQLGLQMYPLPVQRAEEFAGAVASAVNNQVDALYSLDQADFIARLAEPAKRNRLPTIYRWRQGADAGGLLSFGLDLTDQYRRGAVYVDKIFRGAKPEELPIELPTKFEIIINLKAAKELGLTIPPSILAQATEVIQ